MLYLTSLGVLAAYSAVINTKTSLKLVGLIVSLAIVLFDLLWIFMAWQDAYTHPAVEVVLVFVVRFAMSMFGPSLWFTGFCLVILLLLVYNGYLIINVQLPLEDELPSTRRQHVNIVRRPEFSTALVVLLGIVGTILVGTLDTNSIPRNVITIGSAVFQFWALALGAFLLALIFLAAFACVRIYQRRVENVTVMKAFYLLKPEFNSFWFSLLLVEVLLAMIGAFFYSINRFHFTWEVCVFVPLMIFMLVNAFMGWKEN